MRDELNASTAIEDGIVAIPGGDADYWNTLVNEKTAADYLGMTTRWMQSKRQRGDGPIFVRISKRCIRYRRIDLRAYADQQLRSSTSDDDEAVAA